MAAFCLIGSVSDLTGQAHEQSRSSDQCFNDRNQCEYWVLENCEYGGECLDSSFTCPYPNFIAVCFPS